MFSIRGSEPCSNKYSNISIDEAYAAQCKGVDPSGNLRKLFFPSFINFLFGSQCAYSTRNLTVFISSFIHAKCKAEEYSQKLSKYSIL